MSRTFTHDITALTLGHGVLDERERERERDRETERQRDREGERQRDRDREREQERERARAGERESVVEQEYVYFSIVSFKDEITVCSVYLVKVDL